MLKGKENTTQSVTALMPNYAFLMEYQYQRVVSCGTFPYFKRTARSRSDNSWVHNSRHALRGLLTPTPFYPPIWTTVVGEHTTEWCSSTSLVTDHSINPHSTYNAISGFFQSFHLPLRKSQRKIRIHLPLLSRFPVHPKKQ